jgi:NAD(P)-dependent dehydrogenase (short-subunit alcohol dehydrogenase family)
VADAGGPRRYDGWHVAVTGAGTGIGRAIALRLAEEGATLTLLARGRDRLEAVAEEVGGAVEACDLRDRAATDEAFERATAARGPLRAVVANAGLGGGNDPGPGDRFDDLVATNLTGTYNTVRAAQRSFADGPETRHVVVIASVLARIGVPGYTGYCASKAGLLGLVRALAAELAGAGVQVNAVCPGWVETEMAWEGIDAIAAGRAISRAEALADAMTSVPLGRMSRPQDIAGTVAWLLSDDARGATGQGIDINGGAWM